MADVSIMYFHDISYYFRLPILYLQEDDESDLMGQENDDNVSLWSVMCKRIIIIMFSSSIALSLFQFQIN